MMALTSNDAKNASYSKTQVTGTVFFAPAGTPLPKSASEALGSVFKNAGFIGKDGISWKVKTESSSMQEMGGRTIKTELTSYSEGCTFTLMEYLRSEANELRYGAANVSTSGAGTTIYHAMPTSTPLVLVIDTILSDGSLDRIVAPSALMTEVGDIKRASSEELGHEVTFEFSPSTAINNATSVEYIGKKSGEAA
ncbi:tail protein [Alloscardovia macacae]|uniref:Tail protein n=2 Tax=Alloscardovia macacae TaxID=1160091 RepID=A0A261F208_9BIFI|nr:tail protein [Alloscardovia macacae]